jgi:hypothetical protein
MSNTYNISCEQGSTLLLNLTANDSNNLPINLSGYGVRGYVRYSYGSDSILYDLNPQITNSISGIIYISGNATGTAALPIGKFPYDLEAYSSGGYVTKFLKGYFILNPESSF